MTPGDLKQIAEVVRQVLREEGFAGGGVPIASPVSTRALAQKAHDEVMRKRAERRVERGTN